MATETKYKTDTYTLEEYLVMEEAAEYKSEYHGGKIVAMAGGSFDHNTIGQNAGSAISNQLRAKNKSCRVANSDQKIYIDNYDKGVYPDVSVFCDKPQFHKGRKDIITNPILVVEVLSPSTEGYDRGAKFTQYRSIPSFKEYVLIAQDKAWVESFYKVEEDVWRISNAEGLDSKIQLFSLGIEITLADIYHLVDFELPTEEK